MGHAQGLGGQGSSIVALKQSGNLALTVGPQERGSRVDFVHEVVTSP